MGCKIKIEKYMQDFIENNQFILVLTLLMISGASLFLAVYLKYLHWRNNWLSELIVKETSASKKIIYKKQILKIIKTISAVRLYRLYLFNFFNKVRLKNKIFLKQLPFFYLPSISSLLLISIGFVVIFFFSHGFQNFNLSNIFNPIFYTFERGDNYYNNYLNILTGLSGIIIALVIFIAESVRNNKDKIQKQLLLKETLLWPLTSIMILSFLNFIYFRINFLSVILILLVILFSIYAFYKGIKIMLDPQKHKELAEDLFRDRIKLIIYNSILGRVGNNILFKKLGVDNEIKIEYTLSKGFIPNQKDYIYVEGEKDGYITDIHLGELKNLAIELEKTANELGFSIYNKDKPFIKNQADEKGGESAIQNKTTTAISPVYLLKRFRDYLEKDGVFNKDGRIVFALPKDFSSNQKTINLVKQKIGQIFKFEELETSSDELSRELKDVKNRIILSINDNNSLGVEDNVSIYIKVIEYFLSELYKFGGGFSYEQATKERSVFPEDEFNEVRWVYQDIWELLQLAIEGGNKNVIRNIAYLPIVIASRAVTARDHYLFQKFLHIIIYLYNKADVASDELKDFMIDRSWRYMKELADYNIEPNLKNEERDIKDEDLDNYKHYAIHLLKIFQELIKSSIDRKDLENFKLFMHKFSGLFSRFLRDRSWNEKETVKEGIRLDIEKAKNEIVFGINSWILNLLRHKTDDALLNGLFEISKNYLPTAIDKLTYIYVGVRSFEREGFWGWDNWEIIPDGVARNIDVSGKLDYLYCIRSLQILRNKTKEEFKDKKIIINRDIALTLENHQNGLFKIIDDITLDNSILDEQSINSKELLKQLLSDAKEEYDEKEKAEIENEKLDEGKINKFYSELVNSFKSNSVMRSLVSFFGNFYDKSGENEINKDYKLWGYNQIDFKEAFIKNPRTHYVGHAEQYGHGLADSENNQVFLKIVNSLDKKDILPPEINKEIFEFIKEKDGGEFIIINTLDHLIKWDFIKQGKFFDSKPQGKEYEDHNWFEGYYVNNDLKIPIFSLFLRNREMNNYICVLDLKKLGDWTQYLPADKEQDKQYQKDMFFFKIVDLNVDNDLRDKIISEKPKWLEKEKDKKRYLNRRVVFQIYEKFKYEIKDENAGVVLKIVKKD